MTINFGDNANVNSIQTGENAKTVMGDEVQGDQAKDGGNVVKDDASVESIDQTFAFTNDTKAFFAAVREYLPGSETDQPADPATPVETEPTEPAFPQSIVDEAEAYAPELVDSTEYDADVASMEPAAFIDAYEAEALKPTDEINQDYMSALIRGTKKYSPMLIRGALAGGEAWLKNQIKKSSWVAAGIAFLSTVRGAE